MPAIFSGFSGETATAGLSVLMILAKASVVLVAGPDVDGSSPSVALGASVVDVAGPVVRAPADVSGSGGSTMGPSHARTRA